MTAVMLDETLDPAATSWLQVEKDSDFPIQNLPFAVAQDTAEYDRPMTIWTRVGNHAINLRALSLEGALDVSDAVLNALLDLNLNRLASLGRHASRSLRSALFELLSLDAPDSSQTMVAKHITPVSRLSYALPFSIGDFTDFYTSAHHAENAIRLMAGPDAQVAPAFWHMPQAYHGRSSSVLASPANVRRPSGQVWSKSSQRPKLAATAMLDYEVEVGAFIGCGNALGEPIGIDDADGHIFGLCLLNDVSARDIQRWEARPLGPFLAKNFATVISPWVVTMEALTPFRSRGEDRPVLPYLRARQGDLGFSIDLETHLIPDGASKSRLIAKTSFGHQTWTIGQMIAHHTINGCNLRPGDLIGSGTVSGPQLNEAGSLLELAEAGHKPIKLEGSSKRSFLEDGDELVLRGRCHADGFAAIGFGDCRLAITA